MQTTKSQARRPFPLTVVRPQTRVSAQRDDAINARPPHLLIPRKLSIAHPSLHTLALHLCAVRAGYHLARRLSVLIRKLTDERGRGEGEQGDEQADKKS